MAKDLILSQEEYKLFLHRIRGHNGQRPNRPPVKGERSFWRDLTLLKMHRDWGYDVPMCDIDLLEYDNAKPVALFEWKMRDNWQTAPVERGTNLRALITLGNRARLPVFALFYPATRDMFRIVPLNDYAKANQKAMFAWENTLLKS